MSKSQEILDHFKLSAALAILQAANVVTIRRISLKNLARWREKGVRCSPYYEWSYILSCSSDDDLIDAMTGEGEKSNRLRQSPPYTGLMSKEKRMDLLKIARLAEKGVR